MKGILKVLKVNVLVVMVAFIYSGYSDNNDEVVLNENI